MAGLTPTLQSSLSSLQFSLPNRLQLPPTCSNVAPLPPGLKPPFFTAVCSQQPLHPSRPEVHPSRRDVAAFLFAAIAAGVSAKDAQAAASSIVVKPPPPPSGGLPGTLNADQARDLDLPLTKRFYIQQLPPSEAAVRAKKSVGEIIGVKSLIDKKAWPYVQNDLRLQASYLRYDLNTILSTKTKEEKRSLKALAARLFDIIDSLDFAARSKNVPKAEKYYAEAVTILNDLLAKIA